MPSNTGTDPNGEAPPEEDDDDAATAAGAAALNLVPEAVRNSPEFRALEKQNRKLARQNGSLTTAAAAARQQAEEARQAAEAQQQAAIVESLRSTLGEDGLAAYQEVAELSATDPAAAARRFGELMQARAQSAAAQTPPAAGTTPPAGGTVSNTPPPPPGTGVGGNAPLGQATTGEDMAALVTELESGFQRVAKANQNHATRNRVTMRDRAAAMIGYLGAAYLKAGAKPSTPRT